MAVTAQMVKELREMTGAGMMDCKKALVEADGDMDRAVEVLREKGLSKAAKKAGRIAAMGLVKTAFSEDGKTAAIVEVNSETDFVAKNDEFIGFVEGLAKLALDAAHIITYEQYTELELTCSYSDYQRYQAELPRFGAIVDDTDFSDRVRLTFAVKDAVVEPLLQFVREASGGRDEPTVRGRRFDYR